MSPHPLFSMTGFGRTQTDEAGRRVSVELRTVNGRFLDMSINLPREWQPLEPRLRARLKAEVPRGKLDCRVRWTPAPDAPPQAARINTELARSYIDQMRPLMGEGGLDRIDAQAVLGLPGVVESAAEDWDEEATWAMVEPTLTAALEVLHEDRAREGEALRSQLRELSQTLRAELARVDALRGEVVEKARRRLGERLAELQAAHKVEAEPGRLEMEVAAFADRADITEEVVRLGAHLDRFDAVLDDPGPDPVGKNLDFLVQEFHREINTIGSKARDTELTPHMIAMKSATEQVREQIQNIQ